MGARSSGTSVRVRHSRCARLTLTINCRPERAAATSHDVRPSGGVCARAAVRARPPGVSTVPLALADAPRAALALINAFATSGRDGAPVPERLPYSARERRGPRRAASVPSRQGGGETDGAAAAPGTPAAAHAGLDAAWILLLLVLQLQLVLGAESRAHRLDRVVPLDTEFPASAKIARCHSGAPLHAQRPVVGLAQ